MMPVEVFTDKATKTLTLRLNEFKALWLAKMAAEPQNWPALLSEADWYEQFFEGFMKQ